MLILDVINDIHYVDLITISNDYPVSVRDALFYSELITNDEIIICTHLYDFKKNKVILLIHMVLVINIYMCIFFKGSFD